MPARKRINKEARQEYEKWKDTYPSGYDRTQYGRVIPDLVARYDVEEIDANFVHFLVMDVCELLS